MALPPSLEWTLRQACVGVGGSSVLPDHLGKVHHVGDGALTREWTFGLVAAVAGWRGGLAVGLQDLFVVSGDLILHTRETAVTDFQGVSVEDLAQGMFLMKRRLDNIKEFPADVGFHVTTPGWVEVLDFSFSHSFLFLLRA